MKCHKSPQSLALSPSPHAVITLLPVCGQLAYLLLAIFIFVLEAMSGPNVLPFFFGFAGAGDGGLCLMAPVAAANHDFNDFQHWLRLPSPRLASVNWSSRGGR